MVDETAETLIGRDTLASSRAKNEERRENVKSSSSSRWRSTGWTPLAYPASSFYRSSVPNPHFPLHRDVLLAATRELLVLDGTVDGNSLELIAKTAAPLTSDPQLTTDSAADEHSSEGDENMFAESEALEKRNMKPSDITTATKKRKLQQNMLENENYVVTVEEEPQLDDNIRQDHTSAEALANSIVKKSLIDSSNRESPILGPTLANAETAKSSERPPRKVSDADGETNGHFYSSAASQALLSTSSPDLSLFLNLSERTVEGSYPLLRWDLPPLLVVSIVSESKLRDAAQQMTTKLAARFDDFALRQFLGYKSSIMKRDRLLCVLSEFLFDVSHAMFAWEQTESEILSERASDMQSSTSKLDAAVRDALFDKRALNKIGGFDQSSLLPHAVSIGRLRKRNVRWNEFAKSAHGRRMLRHHRNGTSFAVGLKRRGQRLRPRTVKQPSSGDEGRRSRSSSVTSCDGTESEGETKAVDSAMDVALEPSKDMAKLFDGMPDIVMLRLRRRAGKSWGVLLSKEGGHCLVVRAPENQNSSNAGLSCGDMILTVENERGDAVVPPSTSSVNTSSDSSHDWFRDLVNLFKTSCELHFVIRRVGSLRSVGCIDN